MKKQAISRYSRRLQQSVPLREKAIQEADREAKRMYYEALELANLLNEASLCKHEEGFRSVCYALRRFI